MNQPTSLCFGRPLFETPNPAEDSTADSDEEQLCHLEEDQVLDYAQQLPDGDDDDFEMAYDPLNALGDQPFLGPPPKQLHPGRFMEIFKGCVKSFPGGKTFMDSFREDQYAEER